MDINQIERALIHKRFKAIDNSTALGTYAIVSCDKFFTKGINNRDNARWKRAQFLIVTDCPNSNIPLCLKGFREFAECCQYIIFSLSDIIYN